MPLTGTRILIADDVAMLRRKIRQVLEAQGAAVQEASDGEEVLRIARDMRPDLLVTDRVMPRMTGIEAVRKIRADATLHALPVLMLTSNNTPAERQQGLRAGVNAYMAKPFRDEALVAQVRHVLDETHRRRTAIGRTRRPQILVADDSPLIRNRLERLLLDNGYAVETVDNGLQALGRARAEPPQLALFDVMMPDMGGFETLQSMRRDPLLHHVPVLLMSSDRQAITHQRAERLGANHFFQKPLHDGDVLAQIAARLRR